MCTLFQLPSYGTNPSDPSANSIPFRKSDDDDEVKRKETIGNSIDGAIVESIPGNALSAEDSDPKAR